MHAGSPQMHTVSLMTHLLPWYQHAIQPPAHNSKLVMSRAFGRAMLSCSFWAASATWNQSSWLLSHCICACLDSQPSPIGCFGMPFTYHHAHHPQAATPPAAACPMHQREWALMYSKTAQPVGSPSASAPTSGVLLKARGHSMPTMAPP